MKNVIPKVVCAGIVIKDNKVLIVQRAMNDTRPGSWEIPGGGKEPLEKVTDAVKREVREETGLNVEVDKIVGVFDFTIEKEDYIKDSTQLNFLVKPVGSTDVKLSSEHQNFAWVSDSDLNKYNISVETKEIIRKAFKL